MKPLICLFVLGLVTAPVIADDANQAAEPVSDEAMSAAGIEVGAATNKRAEKKRSKRKKAKPDFDHLRDRMDIIKDQTATSPYSM